MTRKFLIGLVLILLSACNNEEAIIIKPEKDVDHSNASEPELIEEDNEEETEKFIEFSLPNEQVVINLQVVPILDAYMNAVQDQEAFIEKMNLIPITREEETIYLLEFSCNNGLCSYILLDQDKSNEAFLVADLAKYVDTIFSPDENMILLTFNRESSFSLFLTDLIAFNLDEWELIYLEDKDLNYKWPISDIKWENNNTVSFTKPLLIEYTEENIEEWIEAGKQTTTINLQIN